MYDIACKLESHLKKNERSDILNQIELLIPIFHCYGHKLSCQIVYNPRRQPGLGLTDGECVERLWSFLGKFSNISKEMTPEHRTDLLEDALTHYGSKIKSKIGFSLVRKMEKTKLMVSHTDEIIDDLLESSPDLSRDYVRRISMEQKQSFLASPVSNKQSNLKDETSSKIAKLVSERIFLIQLMKKYARGQAVAIRVGRQLKKVNVNIRSLITQHNTQIPEGGQILTFEGVQQLTVCNDSITSNPLLRQLIDCINLYDRCTEEMKLIKDDMTSVVLFFSTKLEKLTNYLKNSDGAARALILSHGLQTEQFLLELFKLFHPYIPIKKTNTHFGNAVGLFDTESDIMQILKEVQTNVIADNLDEFDGYGDIEENDDDENDEDI